MTGRGKVTVRNPAEAVAIAKCWLATWAPGTPGVPAVDTFHPKVCDWCDYPRDLLIQTLEEFSDWAGLFKEEPALRLEIESYETLPADEQHRLVLKAQGYLEEAADKLFEKKVKDWWSD